MPAKYTFFRIKSGGKQWLCIFNFDVVDECYRDLKRKIFVFSDTWKLFKIVVNPLVDWQGKCSFSRAHSRCIRVAMFLRQARSYGSLLTVSDIITNIYLMICKYQITEWTTKCWWMCRKSVIQIHHFHNTFTAHATFLQKIHNSLTTHTSTIHHL